MNYCCFFFFIFLLIIELFLQTGFNPYVDSIPVQKYGINDKKPSVVLQCNIQSEGEGIPFAEHTSVLDILPDALSKLSYLTFTTNQ